MQTPNHAESGSVKFHHIGPVEFWMTQLNRIFLVVDGKPVFPSLQGGSIIRYDSQFKGSPEVEDFLVKVLRKQRDIRAGWASTEEDETAYEFS